MTRGGEETRSVHLHTDVEKRRGGRIVVTERLQASTPSRERARRDPRTLSLSELMCRMRQDSLSEEKSPAFKNPFASILCAEKRGQIVAHRSDSHSRKGGREIGTRVQLWQDLVANYSQLAHRGKEKRLSEEEGNFVAWPEIRVERAPKERGALTEDRSEVPGAPPPDLLSTLNKREMGRGLVQLLRCRRLFLTLVAFSTRGL